MTPAPEQAAETAPLPPGTFRGELLGRGVECMQLRLDSGEQISLEGQDFQAIPAGTVLRLTGDFARMSRCMQGRALIVRSFATEQPATDSAP
jgi:hypothetical protein